MYWNRPRFWTYMLTNWEHTTIYTGVTNHFPFRLIEHYIGINSGFSSDYKTYYLVWYEETKHVLNAIAREKEIKSMKRERKIALIEEQNPLWHHLNEEILGNWPPALKLKRWWLIESMSKNILVKPKSRSKCWA